MQNIAIYGAGVLAKLTHFYVSELPYFNTLCFVVDDAYKYTDDFHGIPVKVWSQFREEFAVEDINFFLAIGYKSMRARASIYQKVKDTGYSCINILAKGSSVAQNVTLGDNNIVMPGAVIEPFCNIQSNNVFWSNATICHDTKIGSHNFFASNTTVGGEVEIGNANFFGFSSTVIQQRVIENDVLVGAASLVLSNLDSLSHFQGVPAKKIKKIQPKKGVSIS